MNLPKPILQKIIQCILVGILTILVAVGIINYKNNQTPSQTSSITSMQTENANK